MGDQNKAVSSDSGHEQQDVAGFSVRLVFTCEDVMREHPGLSADQAMGFLKANQATIRERMDEERVAVMQHLLDDLVDRDLLPPYPPSAMPQG